MSLSIVLMMIQVFFAVVIGMYFWNLLRNQQTNRSAVDKESERNWRSCASCDRFL